MHPKRQNPLRNNTGAGLHMTAQNVRLKSVQLLRQLLAADALVVALHGSGELTLALCSRLLVKLTRTQLGQQTGFFNGALEATHGNFERLVFFKANCGHVNLTKGSVEERGLV
jgi:hypothetical protein